MVKSVTAANVDRDRLRRGISDKYTEVALEPEKGFHFHTGQPLADMLGYARDQYAHLPAGTIDSFGFLPVALIGSGLIGIGAAVLLVLVARRRMGLD